jgi:hypothetical protein
MSFPLNSHPEPRDQQLIISSSGQPQVNALSSANGPAHGRAVRKEFNGRGFDQHVARCIDERCLQSGVGDGLEFFPSDLVFSSMALSPVPVANAAATTLLSGSSTCISPVSTTFFDSIAPDAAPLSCAVAGNASRAPPSMTAANDQ